MQMISWKAAQTVRMNWICCEEPGKHSEHLEFQLHLIATDVGRCVLLKIFYLTKYIIYTKYLYLLCVYKLTVHILYIYYTKN